jgi:DNA-directed RNA polymerase II subunit RPB2
MSTDYQNIKQDPGMQDQQMDNAENEITQEDAWAVIRSYFDQHGLVSQQISSFDRFLNYTIQDIVHELRTIEIQPEKQYAPGSKPHPTPLSLIICLV